MWMGTLASQIYEKRKVFAKWDRVLECTGDRVLGFLVEIKEGYYVVTSYIQEKNRGPWEKAEVEMAAVSISDVMAEYPFFHGLDWKYPRIKGV